MAYVKAADRRPGWCSRCPGRIDGQGTRTMCSRCAENKAVGEARRRGHVEYNLVYRRDRLPPGDRAYLRVASLRDEADVWAHFARQHRMSLSALAREAIRAYIDLADDADDD